MHSGIKWQAFGQWTDSKEAESKHANEKLLLEREKQRVAWLETKKVKDSVSQFDVFNEADDDKVLCEEATLLPPWKKKKEP